MVVQMESRFHSSVRFVGPSRFSLSQHKSTGTICTTSNFKSKFSALTWQIFVVNNSIMQVKLKAKLVIVLVHRCSDQQRLDNRR